MSNYNQKLLLKMKAKAIGLTNEIKALKRLEHKYKYDKVRMSQIMSIKSQSKNEARATNLAMAYLRNKPYLSVEQCAKNGYILSDCIPKLMAGFITQSNGVYTQFAEMSIVDWMAGG